MNPEPQHIKIAAFIPSAPTKNNQRGGQRDSWIDEAQKKEILQANFLISGVAAGEDEDGHDSDYLDIPARIFDGEHVTTQLIEMVEYLRNIRPYWVLICDNYVYLWIERILPILRDTAYDMIYYESEEGNFYFIKRKLLRHLDDSDAKKDVVAYVKANNYPMLQLKDVAHPMRYPKQWNTYYAILGKRYDRIVRAHERRYSPHVAIMTIALGKYDRFFGGWYEAIQERFLPDCTRYYYVFTDSDNLPYIDCGYCKVIKQENLGWPGNTRDRFSMYLRLKDELIDNYDYIYFLQVTARLTEKLTAKDCVPTAKDDWMWVTRNIDIPHKLTYDPNPRSAAYIPKDMGRIYVQGGAFGGRSKEFFQMCEACVMSLEHNRQSGIGEFLNDESHMNHYFLTKHPKEGWLRFWWPPEEAQADRCKIYTLEKRRYGGFRALKRKD